MCHSTVTLLLLLLLLFVFLFLVTLTKSQDAISSLVDVNALNELPLENLLNVKKNLEEFRDLIEPAENRQSIIDADLPEALPLSTKYTKPKKRGGYYIHLNDDEYEKKNKKSITSIFQLSVTVLAFLAFGGYLVYLVVAAIRAKNNAYYNNPQIQIMSALVDTMRHRKRRKKKKRKRRPIKQGSTGPGHHFGFNKHHGHVEQNLFPRVKREGSFGDKDSCIDGESLYSTLVDLSEGYAKLYALDFVKVNYTPGMVGYH